MLRKSFARVSIHNPLQTILKRYASSINFETSFTSPNGNTFKILPLKQQDKDETCELLAQQFSTREPLGLCIDIPFEDVLVMSKILSQRAIEENTGTIFKDAKGRIVAANVLVDEYNLEKKPLDFSSVSQKGQDLLNMLDQCYPPLSATKEKEVFVLFMTAVRDDPELKNQKIARRTKSFMASEHPILSKAKKVITQATNPTIIILNKKMRWNLVNTYDPKTYQNKQGEFIFKGLDQISQTHFGANHPGINIMEYKPQNIELDIN